MSAAEFHQVPFLLSGSAPLRVSLKLQRTVVVAQHKQSDAGDSIRVQVNEDDPDWDYASRLLVEVRTRRGKILWSHDFGLNLSSPQGNTVAVSYQPKTHLLLLTYAGYKGDDDQKLLVVSAGRQPLSVREYSDTQRDILPFLKRQKDFPDGCRYSIHPVGLTSHGVEFECLPLQKPTVTSVHPFDPDEPDYLVAATVATKGKMVPTKVKTTRGSVHKVWP